MFDDIRLPRQLFEELTQIDEKIVDQIAAGRCPLCGGPLHRSDFARKPRGALMAAAGEEFVTRFSLCCARDGCRKRATPPSLRFLGRRVYLGAVVIMASVIAQALTTAKALRQATGVPARTSRRWLSWWRGAFLLTDVFVKLRARLIGVVADKLPASILSRLGDTVESQVRGLLHWLTPLTTGSGNGSRLLRDIA
jgi:hypothetical protein